MDDKPAGWYRDPTNAPQLRYWDGRRWTGNTATDPDDLEVPREHHVLSTPRDRVLLAVAVVLFGVIGFVLWGPRPSLDREKAINGVTVVVSTEQHRATRNEANCIVDASVRKGVPLSRLARPELLDDDDTATVRSTLRACNFGR